jgi:hypothetical protein
VTLNSFEIDQVLFGYERGHRLLVSSCPIPPEVEDRLLPLTDAGFRGRIESLTGGEPVAELGSYLLYRSWPAAEVSRRGAVWTHGLLVSFGDLARIPDLGVLLGLLHRPGKRGVAPYQRSTRLDRLGGNAKRMSQSAVASEILPALYGSPAQQIAWPSPDPDQLLADLMPIWSQQWPRLRRSFSFKSVAEGAPRFLSEIDLIISADPEQGPPPRGGEVPAKPRELEVALRDLNSGGGPLREFLWRYGAEAGAGRDAFWPLVRMHLASSGSDHDSSLERQLALLTSEFPAPSEMAALKRALVGRSEQAATEAHRLQALIDGGTASFDPEDLEIGVRTQEIWLRDRNAALALLVSAGQTPKTAMREEFSAASIPLLHANELARLAGARGNLFRAFVKERRDLLTTQSFWRSLTKKGEGPALAAVRRIVVEDQARREVLRSLISLGREETVAAFYPEWPDIAIAGLSLLSRRPFLDGETLRRWVPILASSEDEVIDWLPSLEDSQPAIYAALASFLDPTRASRATAPKTWVPLAGADPTSFADVDPVEVMAFVVAVGFAAHGANARKLIRAGVAIVDQAVVANTISERAWRNLERALPPGKSDWDPAEHLRRGLVDAVLADDWSKKEVLDAVAENHPLGERVAKLLEERRKKKGLARKILDLVRR